MENIDYHSLKCMKVWNTLIIVLPIICLYCWKVCIGIGFYYLKYQTLFSNMCCSTMFINWSWERQHHITKWWAPLTTNVSLLRYYLFLSFYYLFTIYFFLFFSNITSQPHFFSSRYSSQDLSNLSFPPDPLFSSSL